MLIPLDIKLDLAVLLIYACLLYISYIKQIIVKFKTMKVYTYIFFYELCSFNSLS